MINSDKKGNERLPEFQKYLIDKKLVAESKTSYFAYWVSRYLAYARRHKAPVDDYQEQVVAAFLDEMRSDSSIKEWQPRQADDALRLYEELRGSDTKIDISRGENTPLNPLLLEGK